MQRNLLALAVWASVFAPILLGQANNATVTGVVTDTDNAVIPGARVTVRNVDQSFDRSMETNEEGVYVVVNLAPGSYDLIVESEGFRSYHQTGITLRIGDTIRADVRLEVGAVTESITVDAQMVTLNTENGSIKGDVIVQEEIQELPLAGRDFTDLAFFTPGVIPQPSGGQGSALVVNGARASNTNFYVDGFDNRNARGAAAQVRPNIDALQEFKMEVSGYSAEYGKMAGGVLNMALRSGTNELHGNVNYFTRRDILDARGFFDPEKTKLHQHQYAVTAAGPIVKNKTFFMVSYEGLRLDQELTRLTRVPTLLERDGDFSNSLDINNRALYLRDRTKSGNCTATVKASCFANNLIPASRRDAIANNIMAYYPLPNREAGVNGFNYITSNSDIDAWDSVLGKVDQKFGENSLAVRYQIRYNATQNPFAGSDLPYWGNFINDNRSLGGIDYTHIFSPTLLAEFRAGFSRNSQHDQGAFAGEDVFAELGLPNLVPPGEAENEPALLDWPIISITGVAQLGTAAGMPAVAGLTDWQYGAKMTWIKGTHTIKWGYNRTFLQFNQAFYNNQRGTYNFRGNRTGNALADFELGWLQNVTRRDNINRNYWRQNSQGMFFNDDWKATNKLTLNLGVRWEVNKAPHDKYDRLGYYFYDIQKLVIASDANAPSNYQDLLDQTGLRSVVTTAEAEGLPRSVISTDWNNVSPRLGVAYKLNDKTVIRTGYGIFLGGEILNPQRNDFSNQFPFSINLQFTGVNNNPDQVSLATPFPDARETITGTTTAFGFERNPKSSYLQSWNFTIERELPGGTAIEVDYRGSKGTHLLRRYDYNQPFRTLESYIAGGTGGFARPIPEWNAIQFWYNGSNSIYNAFNASWRKRSRGGLFWRMNYSFSKSIDDASQVSGTADGNFPGALDSRNLRLDRARSDFDRRHVFTAIASYELPFGRGRKYGANWAGVVNGLLGGWQLSGTASAYSGRPFTVETANANLNLGESSRPNRLRDGKIPGDFMPGRKGVDFPFYDLSAFVEVPCYIPAGTEVPAGCDSNLTGDSFAFGNSGRNILDGPGLFTTDIALSKNFVIREGHRLQVRIEAFNSLNRPNFLPSNTLNEFNTPVGGLLNFVGGVGRGGGPRVFQYAIKYRF